MTTSTPTFETLLYDVTDGIATITLNRPEQLNAFNGPIGLELLSPFDRHDAEHAGARALRPAGRRAAPAR